MAVTAQGLNEFLNCPEDNAEKLNVYLDAAKSKARAAGVPEYKANAYYDLFIYELAAVFYDRRGSDVDEKAVKEMVNAFVLELRYAGEDPVEPPAEESEA